MPHVPLVNGDTYATLRNFLNVLSQDVDNIYNETIAHNVDPKTCSSIVTQDIFTITGGAVRVYDIAGFVTTAIAAGANNVKLVYTSTGGAAVDLCAVTNIASTAIRRCLSITGVAANALQVSTAEGVIVAPYGTSAELILQPGVVSMNCSGSTAGVVVWSLDFVPLTLNSLIVPA